MGKNGLSTNSLNGERHQNYNYEVLSFNYCMATLSHHALRYQLALHRSLYDRSPQLETSCSPIEALKYGSTNIAGKRYKNHQIFS